MNPKFVLLVLSASILTATGAWAAKPVTSAPALAIYDAGNGRVAQVIDEASAILSSGGKHYVAAVTFQSGDVVIGVPYEILYISGNCTGQAYYRFSSIVSGANYLSQGSPYLVDSRPDGVYLTQFATTNSINLSYNSFQSYVNGQLTCEGGNGAPGYPKSAIAIEIQQAPGPATNVGGAGPYTVK